MLTVIAPLAISSVNGEIGAGGGVLRVGGKMGKTQQDTACPKRIALLNRLLPITVI